ncbi:FecR family protein [Bacteroides sp. 51]|uniref:FecR family protein n=1 Tax=Bacteroides sp. 51 TaxID=2302938 RepID=UPI0013CF6DA7|nr:FecR family protein [Bacteroides sp. 51]NDV81899.1 DUF4974 domain-containing protein [Bacteroides sp. 51]
MEKHIVNLLNKFISGKIDRNERKTLRNAISEMSDMELSKALSEAWNEYDGNIQNGNDFDQLARKLRISPPQQKKNYTLRTVARIAAAIAIPLFIGFQIYLYTQNERLNNFIDNQLQVNIQSGEMADITLPDGTKVYLNSATTMSYPVDFGLKSREVRLAGEAFLDVAKNKEKPFYVHTDYVQIEVLGTKFNINAYPDLNTVETTLIEGSVKLTTKGTTPRSIIMKPNQKVVYNKLQDVLSVNDTQAHFETAWTRGELVFRSATFADVMNKLQKRYGVEIEIVNNRYNADLFSGSFKEEYITGVLKKLQVHYNFTFTDKNEKILIHFN